MKKQKKKKNNNLIEKRNRMIPFFNQNISDIIKYSHYYSYNFESIFIY